MTALPILRTARQERDDARAERDITSRLAIMCLDVNGAAIDELTARLDVAMRERDAARAELAALRATLGRLSRGE